MENKRGFASQMGFLLSMAAFSIGVGNLWKFPYIVGANGGGVFLLIYLPFQNLWNQLFELPTPLILLMVAEVVLQMSQSRRNQRISSLWQLPYQPHLHISASLLW